MADGLQNNIQVFFLIILFTSTQLNAVEFKGKFLQGHYIVGITDPSAEIIIDKKQIRVTKDGYFVFGIGRDRKFDVTITKIVNGEIKKIVKKKQNPEEIKPEIRQSSEFEKKEIIDTNQIAALIDKAKEEEAIKEKKTDKITQSNQKNSFATGLTLSEEDALRAQIFGCWSVPLGLPYDKNLLVRIKLQLKKDGTIMKSEILDHKRMNRPGQKFYKVLAESALRAVRLCQPLKVPPTGYDKWKDIQLNFNPTEMLKG